MLEEASKACAACGEVKPLSKFPSVKRGLYRGGTCNACRYARRAPDPGGSARSKAWKSANRERHLELKRAESKRRTARKAEAEGRLYLTLPERIDAAKVQRQARKEQRLARQREERSDRIAARPWLKIGLSDAERWSLRYKHDPDFNLRERLRTALRHKQNGIRLGELMRAQLACGGRSRTVERKLGYSINDLVTHLERQFTKGMSWTAFLRGDIHIDHRLPLSSFDLSRPDELRAAWALTNLQPMWADENVAKGSARLLLV